MIKISCSTPLKIIVALLCTVLIILGIESYFGYIERHPETDDAYLQAHFLKAASLVAGQVDAVDVHNNQLVKKGQLLFSLNTKPFELERQAAAAQLAMVKQKILGDQDAILAAEQSLKEAKISVVEVKRNMVLTKDLVNNGYAPAIDGEISAAKYQGAIANYKAAQYKVIQAKRVLGNIEHNPAVEIEKVAYAGAIFKLQHAKYLAPNDGIVTNITLRPGQIIAAGEPLFVLIDNHSFWIIANFTETKLKRIKVGQPVSIKIDMYPDLELSGTVADSSNSSGSSFSLLPSQNASGNWVKISQRFPLKITINNMPKSIVPRVGASCSVMVNTNES